MSVRLFLASADAHGFLWQRDQIHTVQEALSSISHPQPVQVTHPGRPGTTLEAQQLVHIDALPPILVLHMKRFCYDTNVGGVVKVGKQVRFAPELDIVNGAFPHSLALRGKELIRHTFRRVSTCNKKDLVAKVQVVRCTVPSWLVGLWWALYA